MSSYFIIEKEQASINSINSVLDEFIDFDNLGASNNYEIALNTTLKEIPNLVFLNVDNVIDNPFQFVSELKEYSHNLPILVAISSSTDKAYQTIKNGFFDYLLQPLTELDIRKTVLKLTKTISLPPKNNLCLKSYKDYRYINTNNILFLKADNNTTDFYMKDGNTISAFKTLKTFEASLPNKFLRIHKSYIVNSEFVSQINYGKFVCTINKCVYKIPFTKTYIDNIELMNKTLAQSSFSTLN